VPKTNGYVWRNHGKLFKIVHIYSLFSHQNVMANQIQLNQTQLQSFQNPAMNQLKRPRKLKVIWMSTQWRKLPTKQRNVTGVN
jgi:hypothetical protein